MGVRREGLQGKILILGSASPRRRELLAGAGYNFIVDTGNNFEENIPEGVEAEDIPALMSAGKSHGFHRELSDNEILLTSDTIVVCEGRPMGKPHSAAEAAEMLRFLSGKKHSVVTAITIRTNAGEKTVSDRAIVHFKELTDNEIEYYVNEFAPFDKAGAYAIQEWIGYIGITGIEGSFYTIMGLPIHLVYRELEVF